MRAAFAAGAVAALLVAVALIAAPESERKAQPIGDGAGGVGVRLVGVFDRPTYIAAVRGFPHLTFVVEQPGAVRVLRYGHLLGKPFLDLRSLVGCGGPDEQVCNEQGLFSIAFSPDYEKSGRLYAYYTDVAGDLRIDEFRRSRHPAVAGLGTRRSVIHIPHRSEFHNGGQLQFHGGFLYLGTGDGGLDGDPDNNAQNLDSLLGKVLRIDPRNPKGPRAYSVPKSNPFVNRPGRDEVFSYGLRNPYRFSFEERNGADRIAIADVGQNRSEEIDYTTLGAARGANFGWDAFEGFAPYDCGPLCPDGGTPDPGNTTPPIFAYGPKGCAVIGGYVVRDRSPATLYRRYLYADACDGELRSLIASPGRASDEKPLGVQVDSVSSFGERPNGTLYVASLLGPVYRIAPG